MEIRDCRVQDELGNRVEFITQAHADKLVDLGDVIRLKRRRYQTTMPIPPSTSLSSPSGLMRSDMEALAGARDISRTRRERLEGHGLLPARKTA
jgi:hypothetical protein